MDSKGSSSSDTLALSTERNSSLLLRSDRLSSPRLAPMLGKKLSLISPGIVSVRCFFSCTSLMICGLYSFGSKVAARMTAATSNRPITAAMTIRMVLAIFGMSVR
ncbi:hypothetical protein D9M68_1000580 [compost metagenome]